MDVKRNAMADVKLIVCDIDNTLVVKHHTLSTRAKVIISQLQERHIYFGIASGRSLEEIKRMLLTWGYDNLDIIIGMNGSILWDGIAKKQYDYYKLKKTWIKEIINLMNPFENNPLLYQNDSLLCREIDDVVLLSAKTAQMDIKQATSDTAFYEEDHAKIMFRVNEADMDDIETYLGHHPSPHFQGFKTQSTLMEFCDKRVSKAYALKKFCALHGLSMSNVMAFGDTTNDNTMLQEAGIGVCMQNGSDDTKALADIITEIGCDEDGWAHFMEHVFLPSMR